MLILASHLMGDYLLQNDWQAMGKKTSSLICAVHVGLYLTGFYVLAAMGILYWWQVAAIGVQHFIQDRTAIVAWYMRTAGQVKFAQPPMSPWSMIAVDNAMHLVFVAAVLLIGGNW